MEIRKGGGIYSTDGISPILIAGMTHGNTMPLIVEEKIIVAERGREQNGKWVQKLESNNEGITNTITSVAKDNLVIEKAKLVSKNVKIKQATKDGYIECEVGGVCDLNYPGSNTRRGRVQENGQVCPTITTENIPNVLEPWVWEIDGVKYLIRIRKLTPRECFRLMDFTDEDFDAAQAEVSNSQLYKQAGNSICKNVLCGIFGQMIEGKENIYKERMNVKGRQVQNGD